MLLQVGPGCEPLIAVVAHIRLFTSVNAFMSDQVAVLQTNNLLSISSGGIIGYSTHDFTFAVLNIPIDTYL